MRTATIGESVPTVGPQHQRLESERDFQEAQPASGQIHHAPIVPRHTSSLNSLVCVTPPLLGRLPRSRGWVL